MAPQRLHHSVCNVHVPNSPARPPPPGRHFSRAQASNDMVPAAQHARPARLLCVRLHRRHLLQMGLHKGQAAHVAPLMQVARNGRLLTGAASRWQEWQVLHLACLAGANVRRAGQMGRATGRQQCRAVARLQQQAAHLSSTAWRLALPPWCPSLAWRSLTAVGSGAEVWDWALPWWTPCRSSLIPCEECGLFGRRNVACSPKSHSQWNCAALGPCPTP